MNLDLLQKFCSVDESRKVIMSPWSFGAWTYATDARVLIRVPRMAEVPEREGAPKADIIFTATGCTEVFQELPAVPEIKDEKCSKCDGEGAHECLCGNVHDCEYCEGSGKVPGSSIRIKIGKCFASHIYLNLLKELPNVTIAEPLKETQPFWFKFDGGEGRLAGMRNE